jgi:hypothetical protein
MFESPFGVGAPMPYTVVVLGPAQRENQLTSLNLILFTRDKPSTVNLGPLRGVKLCNGDIADTAIAQFTAWQHSAAHDFAIVLAGKSGFDLG